ncbi:MAG: Hsp20/alpha crystallin family protein [Verrucomicrobiae bacterium]|nr:Hsp20/alpha crystallin family protein [Verrucomicrobiae bacterium]MCB1090437.1 Hsp20/alpha crystallin family protein [Verrucomicrobiae bacterium]
MSHSTSINEATKAPCETCDTTADRFVEPRYTTRKVDEHTWEIGIAVPGVKREDVAVSLEDSELEVTARRSDTRPDGWRPLQTPLPRPDGYRLGLSLAIDVDPERISAKLEDGILTLRLPVSETAKPRRIAVE